MRYLILILSLYLAVGCTNIAFGKLQQTIADKPKIDTIRVNELPSIGDFLSDSIRLTSNNRRQLVSSSQISPSTTVYSKGLVFNIAWNEKRKVNYIVTYDSNFTTKEKIKLNMALRDIKNIQKVEILKMPGWGYYIELESGWNAGFCVDKTCTGRELVEEDRVKYIFKR